MSDLSSPHNLDLNLRSNPRGESESVSHNSCNDSIVFIQESIENWGYPPGEGGDGS
jgi:hypothetical protein